LSCGKKSVGFIKDKEASSTKTANGVFARGVDMICKAARGSDNDMWAV